MFINSPIKAHSKALHLLYEEKHALTKEYDDAMESDATPDALNSLNKEIEQLNEQINNLIENEYALAVYEKYHAKKPILLRVKTGEEISWNDAFGDDFSKISKSLRHSLVGLVEEPGRYIFKR